MEKPNMILKTCNKKIDVTSFIPTRWPALSDPEGCSPGDIVIVVFVPGATTLPLSSTTRFANNIASMNG